MNRRAFLGAASLAPVAAVVSAPSYASGGYVRAPSGSLFDEWAIFTVMPPRRMTGSLRISIVKGDPGEKLFGMAASDGQSFRVYLNGVEQRWPVTADEAQGFVTRDVETPDGKPAFNKMTGDWVQETVRGTVKIVFDDEAWLAKALAMAAA